MKWNVNNEMECKQWNGMQSMSTKSAVEVKIYPKNSVTTKRNYEKGAYSSIWYKARFDSDD